MLHRLMDFKNLKKLSPIFILLFGVFASAQLPPFSFLKSSSTASVAPTGLALTHSTRNRGFTVSWTAGSGNNGAGGCKLQYYQNGTTWTDLASTYNCDSTTTNAAANLPSGDNWTNNFNGTGVQVRILRISDSVSLGVFGTRATCTTTGDSASPTPNIDEDCDALWDDYTFVQSVNSVSTSTISNVSSPFTCPAITTCTGGDNPVYSASASVTYTFSNWNNSICTINSAGWSDTTWSVGPNGAIGTNSGSYSGFGNYYTSPSWTNVNMNSSDCLDINSSSCKINCSTFYYSKVTNPQNWTVTCTRACLRVTYTYR